MSDRPERLADYPNEPITWTQYLALPIESQRIIMEYLYIELDLSYEHIKVLFIDALGGKVPGNIGNKLNLRKPEVRGTGVLDMSTVYAVIREKGSYTEVLQEEDIVSIEASEPTIPETTAADVSNNVDLASGSTEITKGMTFRDLMYVFLVNSNYLGQFFNSADLPITIDDFKTITAKGSSRKFEKNDKEEEIEEAINIKIIGFKKEAKDKWMNFLSENNVAPDKIEACLEEFADDVSDILDLQIQVDIPTENQES